MKITAQQVTTIEQLISEKMKNISKSKIKQWLKYKQITLNDKIVLRMDESVSPQDIVEVQFEKPLTLNKVFKPRFEVLFEDKHLIACVKPAGILSVGEGQDKNHSFFKDVQTYVRENSKGHEELHLVHRLDREVSGIILFAKTEFTQKKLIEQWKENTKSYYALVEGNVSKDEGSIESYLVDDAQTLKVHSTLNKDEGKLSITHYKVLQRLKDKTLLEISLETGRKNQIRVQLSELGHPIVGDRRYGADATFERQIRLLAFYLKFRHPLTLEWVELKLPLPAFFLHLPNKNERYK